MKLGARLLLPPMVASVVALASGGAYVALDHRAVESARDANAAAVATVSTVGQTRTALSQVRGDVFRTLTLIASMEDAEVKQARTAVGAAIDTVGTSVAGAQGRLADARDTLAPLLATYAQQCQKAIDLSGMDPNVGAGAMRAAEDTYAKIVATLTTLSESAQADVAARYADASGQRRLLEAGFGALLLLSMGGAMGFAWHTRQRVVGQVQQAAALTEAVAGGDLSVQSGATQADEIGDLMRAMDRMVQDLRSSLMTVRMATDHIATASSEIASGNQDLSSRTEQTASSLQQTASSIEQLAGNVGSTADNAQTANQLAGSAAEVAQRGGQAASEVVTTMEEIRAASGRIADIIAVIDGIAFQTNILALNAAVEAARAGEQGRGFAVVASEVRSLAGRSAEAAREIKQLIQASVEKVEAGHRLVDDAGRTMQEIVASVQRVSGVIGEISGAAGEQRTGIGEVNTAVSDLDRMTQQNAALVEESAAAAESLRAQAQQLGAVVARFRIDAA
ncbi:MAG: HAMP domain-containing protein [Burkholderiaceae bacterium]|nr:HAMP domain-containing protein [Burkholderiaceae bacterium]